jgi:hypothetical protein
MKNARENIGITTRLRKGTLIEIRQRLYRKDPTRILIENDTGKPLSCTVEENPEALHHRILIKIR